MDVTRTYPQGTVFQLLLKGKEAARVVEEWFTMNRQADLRIRRAKTHGHVVVETTELLFASHVLTWWPGININIKEAKKQ